MVKDGMIWGDELEWYIKINTKGLLSFKNDEHYLAFEDLVLDRIEKNKVLIRGTFLQGLTLAIRN